MTEIGIVRRWRDATDVWLLVYIALLPVMINNPARPLLSFPVLNRLQLADLAFLGLVAVAWRRGDVHLSRMLRVPLAWPLWSYGAVVLISALLSGMSRSGLVEVVVVVYCIGIYVVLVQVLQRAERLWLAIDAFAVAGVVTVIGGAVGITLIVAGIENPLAAPSRILPIALSIQDHIPWIPRIESVLRPTANMAAAFLATVIGLLAATAFTPGSYLRRIALVGAVVVLPLTFSRVIIAGTSALWLGLTRHVSGVRLVRSMALLATIALLGVMPLLSIFYVRSAGVNYSFTSDAKKEIVEPRAGQPRENPVYFFRHGRGLEHVSLNVDYSYNHYFWLKRAALAMGLSSPLLGIGPGSFAEELRRLQGTMPAVPAGLSGYESAQSQLATTFAELGVIGVVSVVTLWASAIVVLSRAARRESPYATIARGALAAVAGLIIASIDLDMMNFRFFWATLAIGTAAAQATAMATEA